MFVTIGRYADFYRNNCHTLSEVNNPSVNNIDCCAERKRDGKKPERKPQSNNIVCQ